ncbi:Glycosyltransferase involved in cell wall bisynthesis [Chitinophaga sp. YR573]|uniref:glycosyltransferase family 4 protein n=1 Tax=Chitinophaga sp. YR573 TaxID=1881040 RepID=UPI0008BC1709|nr:glycosyltransferase family 4 protein [Chitinophaga sp. YR573]SEW46496.1 Glycosyltransferase involved in cell wall bisynthesis [Chitinophaga sp. YR573]
MKIIAIHLHNDRSGSTMVFRQSLEALSDKSVQIHLITNRKQDTQGFLTGIPGVQYHYINYTERGNKWRTLFSFLLAQLLIFVKIMKLYEPEDKVYINTLQPFGAALAGRLKQAPIIYHIHETAVQPAMLRRFMTKTAQQYATHVVFASRFVQSQFAFPMSEKHVVHSCLPESFLHDAIINANRGVRKTALMVADLDRENGVPELLELAAVMPRVKFELVLNATNTDIERYMSPFFIPNNVTVFDAQLDMHPFYQRAAVVLNLSQGHLEQETFDISILQAMSYGRPVIVPLAGGANELVAHGWNGYRISGHYVEQVRKHVEQLLSNKPLYADMSCAAQLVASQFKPQLFRQQVEDIFLEGTLFTTAKKPEFQTEVLLYPAALQEYINSAMN